MIWPFEVNQIGAIFGLVRAVVCKMISFCNCFGIIKKEKNERATHGVKSFFSRGLLPGEREEENVSYSGEFTSNTTSGDETDSQPRANRSEEILNLRAENDMVCRRAPVKETNKLVRAEDEDGNKMINEYVREYRIGSGSYGKVVLYRSVVDGKHYAIKSFHKSHLLKLRVAGSETAMSDVLREVLIMKMVEHPNIVNLIEVIDDPESDCFYMVLEYVEGKFICEGSGRGCALGEDTVRKYLRDIVSGLRYLHDHNIIHLDIKPDNLLITREGKVKIGDFSVSQAFEDDNDILYRSPGTPVFSAPECCAGGRYHGKASDTWAVGVTLYCMIMGEYPFLGKALPDTYEKILNNPLVLPDDINPQLKNLIEGLLCKDPKARMTLNEVAEHRWVIGDDGPISEYLCWCKQKRVVLEQQH
ncbi:Glutamate receptor ionotropic, kainate 1 [Stylosanthes scabra]|uniref:Glutamate receptor ionotropic, kainate 1 n=2 Tax=Stylosanthes scabra TaxID=79078 RepID=A0ABU6Z7E1_9FABA|nr:Glutamate receptor ionotropic, kainate 1 [Stylosanthes scabra]